MSSPKEIPQAKQVVLDRLFESSAQGDAKEVSILINGGYISINAKNDRGWTALMFAARNGHIPVATILLEKGCDVTVINSTGQTAQDIATFWNHGEVVSAITEHNKDLNPDRNDRNYFSLNLLNRCSEKRKDVVWMENAMKAENTKYILFSNLKPLITSNPDKSNTGRYILVTAAYDEIKSYLTKSPLTIFLGVDGTSAGEDVDKGASWFALDLSAEDDVELKFPNSSWIDPYPGALQLVQADAGIFAEGRSVLAWHERYQFCATCGSSTKVDDSGYKRTCKNAECLSNKGISNTCYPRLDPSVIMLVISPDKKKCLLGRKKNFPGKMWSCLAGFMEPGETIEDTCRREVLEESGVIVGSVEYHSSQPWPFPAVLMLGCIAHATSEEIQVDDEELEDARWFTRQDVVQMMTQQHPQGMSVPPQQAIAHQIIKSWVRLTANL